MTEEFFDKIFVPIADPDDAVSTARAINYYAHEDSEIVAAHVIEKGEGVPDKASVEQREKFAEDAYETFLEVISTGEGPTVQFLTLYGRDVAETIIEGAHEADATLIAFVPRGGSRWAKLISGNTSLNLVENSDIPVLALPKESEKLVL